MDEIDYVTWVNPDGGAAYTNPNHRQLVVGANVNGHIAAFAGKREAAERVCEAINAGIPKSNLTFASLLNEPYKQ